MEKHGRFSQGSCQVKRGQSSTSLRGNGPKQKHDRRSKNGKANSEEGTEKVCVRMRPFKTAKRRQKSVLGLWPGRKKEGTSSKKKKKGPLFEEGVNPPRTVQGNTARPFGGGEGLEEVKGEDQTRNLGVTHKTSLAPGPKKRAGKKKRELVAPANPS